MRPHHPLFTKRNLIKIFIVLTMLIVAVGIAIAIFKIVHPVAPVAHVPTHSQAQLTLKTLPPPQATVTAITAKPVLNIQHWQTSQQVPVYFVRRSEVPMLILHVIFTAGSAYDQQQWGISKLTAGLLNQGTQLRNADQIADNFAQVGAQYDADVDQDMAVVSLQSLVQQKYLQPAFSVFLDVLTHAQFSATAFTRLQQQSIASIKQSQQDPATVALLKFYQILYQQHPYAHPITGTLESMNKLTLNDAIKFYKHFYVAQNAKIVMVGDLTHQQAQQLAEEIAAGLPQGQAAPALPQEGALQQTRVQQYVPFPSQQTTILMGQLGMDYNSPSYFPLFVGNYVLGGLPLDSLLFQRVRRQLGLAYDISSDFSLYRYRGPFIIQLQTRSSAAAQALGETSQVLKNFLQQGPSAQELYLAKQMIINSFPLGLATNRSIASILTNMIFYHLPLNYLDTYRAKVQAVTSAQIKQALASLVQPDKMITVTVGPSDPTAKIKPINSKLVPKT